MDSKTTLGLGIPIALVAAAAVCGVIATIPPIEQAHPGRHATIPTTPGGVA